MGRRGRRHAQTAGDLLAMLRGARVEYAEWKDAYRQSGAGGVQAGIVELETQATRIAEFPPGMISGLLQTSEYAREFLHLACGPLNYGEDEDEIERMVAKQMQQQQVLYQPAKGSVTAWDRLRLGRRLAGRGLSQSAAWAIMQVVVAWAMSLPSSSSTLPSAVAVRRPQWMTVPVAVRVWPLVLAARM